jgi:hypothetical protein
MPVCESTDANHVRFVIHKYSAPITIVGKLLAGIGLGLGPYMAFIGTV